MLNVKIRTGLLALLVLCMGAYAAAQSVAVVVKSSGQVTLLREGESDSALQQGMRLADGDRVRTGEDGRAVLVFTDDRSQLKLQPQTELTLHVDRAGDGVRKEVEMDLGTLWTQVTGEGGGFRVATPTSVASVKGTAWWTRVGGAGETTVITEEGIVNLRNLRSNESRDVVMGFTGVSQGGDVNLRETTGADTGDLERGQLKTIRIPVSDGGEERVLIIEYYE